MFSSTKEEILFSTKPSNESHISRDIIFLTSEITFGS